MATNSDLMDQLNIYISVAYNYKESVKELEEEVQKWKDIADCTYSRPVSAIKWVNHALVVEMAKDKESLKEELVITKGQLWEQKKELEALKEEYEHLRTNYATGWHPKWEWPQEPTRSSSSRSGTSTTQPEAPSVNREDSSPSRSSSPGTGGN